MARSKKIASNISKNEGKSPKVSVIMPVYNEEDYLEQSLQSVLGQTFEDIEIICINDGSSDNSREILNEFKDRDRRVIVIEKEHTNAGDARQIGLGRAKGEYIAFVDADDFVEPDLIETVYNTAVANQADIVHFRCNMWDDNAKEFRECPWTLRDWEMPEHRPFSALDAQEKIFNMGSCSPWDKLFRREFIEENKIVFQSITTCDDMLFTYSALAVAHSITTIGEVLYHQRVENKKHLAENVEKTMSNFSIALTELKEFLVGRGMYETFKKSFLNWAIDFSLWFYNVFQLPFLHGLIGKKLKGGWMSEMGIYELAEEDYYNHDWFEQIKDIRKAELSEKARLRVSVPKVSVIVPVYNAGDNFHLCMDCLIGQTYKDIEIILVAERDDPVSQKLVNDYKAIDKRIVVIDNKNSFSHSGSVNTGIINSSGDYFTIVEPFDFADVTMVERLYIPAVEHDLDFIKGDIGKLEHDEYGNVVVIPRNTARSSNNYDRIIDSCHDRCWRNFYKAPWCTLYKKKFITDNGLYMTESEDCFYAYTDEDFIFNVNINAGRTMYLSDVLYLDTVKSFLFSGYSMPELLQ